MSIEKPEFYQGPKESSAEAAEKEIKKKEIFEGVGVEGVEEIEDILGGIEAQLSTDPENKELLDQKAYFAEVLKQINELQ